MTLGEVRVFNPNREVSSLQGVDEMAKLKLPDAMQLSNGHDSGTRSVYETEFQVVVGIYIHTSTPTQIMCMFGEETKK